MRIPVQFRSVFNGVWFVLTFRYMGLVGLCLWVMYVQTVYRVPGQILFLLLPWISLALGALNFILLFNHITSRYAPGPFQQTLLKIERGAMLIILVFFFYGLVIYLNGSLDDSRPTDQATELLAINGDEIDLGYAIPYTWANLRSWNNPNQIERIFLNGKEREWLWGGEAVQVKLRKGYFHIPWVLEIEKDQEKASLEILKLNPKASDAWVQLVYFYIESRRWKEASDTAHEYLKIYPKNYDFAHNVGSQLIAYGQKQSGVKFIEYVVEKRPTYQDAQTLGWTLHLLGENQRAIQVLETSIPLDPDNWQVYYNLGDLYLDMGKYEVALGMFEKAVQREPNFPELQQRINFINGKMAALKAKSRS